MIRAPAVRRGLTCIVVAALSAGALGTPAFARPPALIRHTVAHDGVALALWEKAARHPHGTLLLVHGRTWSALPNFDLAVPGRDRSVMNALVRAGWSTYALDLRGYGQSPRDATGWITPASAMSDVRAALDWIAAKHGGLRPALLGYSRGSQVSVLLAQGDPSAVSALVLFGFPPAMRSSSAAADAAPLRKPTTKAAAAEDFITPGAQPRAVVDAYAAQATSADPVRADWRDEGEFRFDAPAIHVPTLMLYGVNDPFRNDAAAAFFAALGTADRALVVLPASDHAAHVEDSGPAWVHAVVAFLEQPRLPAN